MMMDGDSVSLPVIPDDGFPLDGADVCPTCGKDQTDPQDSRFRDLLFERDEEIRELKAQVAELKDTIKGLQKRPQRPKIKPSGLARAGEEGEGQGGEKKKKRGRGPRQPGPRLAKRVVEVPLVEVPEGARRDGVEERVVRHVVMRAEEVTYRLAVWRSPDGCRHVAPMPAGVVEGKEQYGLEIKALVIALYYQCQSTIGRIVTFLNDLGLGISSRQVRRYLNEATKGVVEEAGEVLRAGLRHAPWINVDDTGARHQAQNGFCTAIGNDRFTHFRSTDSKGRLNFLRHLCAGEDIYTVNAEAVAYLHRRKLPKVTIALLVDAGFGTFSDEASWRAHLDALRVKDTEGAMSPLKVVTEGALWGALYDRTGLNKTVIVSDDARQFDVGVHALCWVHAERLLRKYWVADDFRRMRVEKVLDEVWDYYRALSVYRETPDGALRETLSADFDRIFGQRTGYTLLDIQLARLKENRTELLRVLEYPFTPLHTNLVENDIRCQVTRRKISFGTRSAAGRLARDACLGARKTCQKWGISFWDYLNHRLGVAGAPVVPRLETLIDPP